MDPLLFLIFLPLLSTFSSPSSSVFFPPKNAQSWPLLLLYHSLYLWCSNFYIWYLLISIFIYKYRCKETYTDKIWSCHKTPVLRRAEPSCTRSDYADIVDLLMLEDVESIISALDVMRSAPLAVQGSGNEP